MKRTIASLCIFSAFMSTAQQMPHFAKTAFLSAPTNIQNTTTNSQSTLEAVEILSEDFSLFTAGSEEKPDSTNLAPGDNYIYKVNEAYTHTPGWGGYYVFQAGGACALFKYVDPYYGQGYGHIQTPEQELFGTSTITFRARRAYSNPGEGNLDLSICDNYSGRLESTTIQLSDQWQEYSWTTNKGTFNAHNIFQFNSVQGEILLDDIKISRIANRIPPTEATNPINNSPTEFTAQWLPSSTEDIDGYIFNAYYKDMPENAPEPGSVSCDFESISIKEDGKSIDTVNPNYPDGWYINVSEHGEKDMCTDSGNFNSGKQGINFDAAGDTIISPVTPAPINKISFWIKPSSMDIESGYNYSLVGVAVRTDNGEWEQIANLPNYWLTENGGYYTFEGDQIGNYMTQVRLTCETSYEVTFAIDDLQLDYAPQPVPVPLIKDEFTTDTFRIVSDIDPTKEHFYYVQVKKGEIISDPTYDMWVDGINGVTPTALEASDIFANGFTANWETIYNAGSYRLSIGQKITTTSDNQEIVLAHEDFSGLTEGTVSAPHNPWTMTHNLCDNGQSEQDWMLVNPQWANGMAGSTGTSWTGAAGLVLSPKVILGNNPVKIDFSAYNTVIGDKLWVMVIEEYNSPQAIVGSPVDFSTTEQGFISGSVTFDNLSTGDQPVHIAFMSQEGKGFFIDEAKITITVPNKGTTIEKNYKILNPETNFCTLTDLPEGITSYTYNVIAKRTKDFINYASNVSNTVEVELPAASVAAVTENAPRIFAADGTLHIICSDNINIGIYNMQGMEIKALTTSPGDNLIQLPSGLYIIKANDAAVKVSVR